MAVENALPGLNSVARHRPAVATLAVAAALLAGACQRTTAGHRPIQVSWTLGERTVGPTRLIVRLREESGAAMRGANVRVEGHMSHPGMTPVLATAIDRGDGEYDARFAFTMPGDWVLLVVAIAPDGQRIERRIDVANVRPAA